MEPLVLVPGICSDEVVWRSAPPGQVLVSSADTIDGMAQDILALAPPRFALAGHSMGGYIALAMFAAAPERVTRLALLSTAAAPDDEAQRAARLTNIAAAKTDFSSVVQRVTTVAIHPDHRDAVADVMLAMAARVGLETYLRQQNATLRRPDRRPLLPSIAVPTLIMTGDSDPVVLPKRSYEMAELIPTARLVTARSCAHMLPLETPDLMNTEMTAWLAR